MRLELRRGGRSCAAAIVLILAVWGFAAALSDRPLGQVGPLLVAQAALTVVACLLVWRHAGDDPADLRVVLPLHALLYSGLSNVVPALLPDLRPTQLAVVLGNMPKSGPGDFAVATLAALGLLAGWATGLGVVSRLFPASGHAGRPMAGRPGATSTLALFVLLAFVLAGTLRYGLEFGLELPDLSATNMGLAEQLFFHGLFSFLPIGPALATFVWLRQRRRRPATTALLVGAAIVFVAALGVWRMRSTAMLAVVLPVVLVASRRQVDVRRWALPAVILVGGAYAVITAVKIRVEEAALESQSATPVVKQSILGRALFDASYRTAGLEPVAALVAAQGSGRLRLQEGRVVLSGFKQALPAAMRSELEVPERVKTAPTLFGVFGDGDWVTTFEAEAVLDAGAALTFLPGFVAGLLLGAIDRALLRIGNLPGFDGVLVVRMAFLLYPIAVGGSLAEMTLMFLKATVGYAFVFLLAGLLVNVARLRRAEAGGSVAG